MAYQLMNTFHRKVQLKYEITEGVDEVEPDEIDGVAVQCEVEVSSAETSSISGSESMAQFKIPIIQISEKDVEDIDAPQTAKSLPPVPFPYQNETVAKVGIYNVSLLSEFNLLVIGICLTVLLAIFSCLLLLKITTIEQTNESHVVSHLDTKSPLTIEDAESILNTNVLIVRNVRKKLEDLQLLMLKSFENIPTRNDKEEF